MEVTEGAVKRITHPTRIARTIHLLTRPPKSPLWQLTIYFTGLILAGWLIAALIPAVAEVLVGATANAGAGGGELRDLLADPQQSRTGSFLIFDLQMFVVMFGTLLITIPFSWGYMTVREHAGYEQSVVQTLVLLPVVVSAIMMVVQNSLALAFALGGVAAAVRFRNTLKDVADATYVFLAIGLGIAAGSGVLTGALVMAALFTYVSIMLWRCDYGLCPTARHVEVASVDDLALASPRRVRGEVLAAVRDGHARTAIEDALSGQVRKWKLAKASNGDDGTLLLHYAVQLKRSGSPDGLSVALQGLQPDGVESVAFQIAPEAA